MSIKSHGIERRRRRLKRRSALAIAALLVAAPLTAAQADDLSQALETALRSSPDLKAQLESVRGLNEGVAAARSGMRPSLTGAASAGYNYSDSSESLKRRHTRPATVSVTASQPLFDGFQTENAVEGAIATVRSGRQLYRQTEQSVLLNAVIAYIGVIQAVENVTLAGNDVTVTRRSLQAARDRFDVGEVTRTDVSQAEAALALSQANLAEQQGLLRQARETYARQVGVMPGTLAPLPPLPPLPQSLEEVREVARRNHPSILSAKESVSAAGFAVNEAEGAVLPQVDLNASASASSETAGRRSGVMAGAAEVQVTVPLYQGGVLRSNIRRSQALESQRYQELRSVSRQILEQAGIAWENFQTAGATIRSNTAAVRANEVALEGVRQEANVGSRTTLDVLEAQQRLLDAQVALLNSRTNQQVAAYQLLAAIGTLSSETMSLASPRPDLEGEYQAVQGVDLAYPETVERPEDWLMNYEN